MSSPDDSADGSAEPSPVIWARLDRSARRPQPSLSHEQIVRAAIEIADAEGAEALSMRKVASKLGAGTMSLYRYVATKDDLLDLMVDAALGEEELPDEPSGDWRAELAEMARRSRRLGLRHPWMIGFIIGRPNFGPNLVRLLEYSMAGVDGLGLDADGMLDMTSTVSAFVAGFVQAELAEAEALRRTGLTEEQWRARMGPYIRELLATGRYPFMERIMIEAEDYPDADAMFERRLSFVLDGLAANLARRAAVGPGEPSPRSSG
jgi:AcrR family transcriptional regulator